MAWTAIYEGEEKGAWEIPTQTDAYCTECGEVMRVWREGADGTARHLKHKRNIGGARDGSGGGTGTSCGGGESDDHIKWKNFAAERLYEVFDDVAEATVEMPLAAPKTEKFRRAADAAVMFDGFDEQLGNGLAVEVQHKNKDKDIEGTTRDYLAQDVAVVWLTGDDFHSDGCRLTEADFRKLARDAASLSMFKPRYATSEPPKFDILMHAIRSTREAFNIEECDHELAKREFHVPATLPTEWFDEAAQSVWRSQPWSELFSSVGQSGCYESERYISEVQDSLTPRTHLRIRLPPEINDKLARRFWERQPWPSLFSGVESREYITEVQDSLEQGRVEATIDFDVVVPESQLRAWYKIGAKKTPEGRFHCACPNCGEVSGSYSQSMTRGSHQCSCGTTYKIDVDNQEAGEVLS